ncbi:MAG: MFS transporter [Solirubrobacteraceae bacterium]
MSKARLLLATVAAYLPAGALPPLAEGRDVPGGPLDPAVLTVPFCLGFAIGFPAWGRLADRRDPAWVIRVALVLTALAGVLVAVAPGEAALIGARALQGLAAAGVPPAVQAAMAASAAQERTGRAMSPMMLAVAVAVFVGPAVAPLIGDWTLAAIALGVVLPLAVSLGPIPATRQPVVRAPRETAPYLDARGVHAGWLVSALVLAGHWTVLTRLVEAPGDSSIAALTGVVGLPLVVLAARASDAVGPRRTMTATLIAGALGFSLASTAGDALVFTLTAGVGIAVYWAYLPVVAAQVQRSAGELARGRAAGGLYASMWGSAAAAGLVASFAPSWREVLVGAGVLWAAGAIVAAREFLGASVAWRGGNRSVPRPSPR